MPLTVMVTDLSANDAFGLGCGVNEGANRDSPLSISGLLHRPRPDIRKRVKFIDSCQGISKRVAAQLCLIKFRSNAMTAMTSDFDGVRTLTSEEIDQVGGGVRFVLGAIVGGLIYDAAKHAFNSYGEAMSELPTDSDYENHPDYEGIGGPF